MTISSTNPQFSGLGLAPRLIERLLTLKIVTPTPIQAQCIPAALEGKDLIGVAQTGTGKTLAFGLPMLQRLAQVSGQGLIIVPTRELAIQVDEAIQSVGRGMGLRTAVLIGGASMVNQVAAVRRKPHIYVATPGRLIDHLEQKIMDLSGVKILVLDEADRMLDMGFAPQINRILAVVPKERQTMLFSATMPDAIVRIANHHMKLPLRVEIARSGTAAETVTQEVFFIGKEGKPVLLHKILSDTPGSVLVFTRTKHVARRLARRVKDMGFTAADIHSDRTLAQRRHALEGFKRGQFRVLVATDIAARGIDVTGIELVINYDLPQQSEDYVHRIGRTGRAGRPGRAISFATFDQRAEIKSIERLIRLTLRISPLPDLTHSASAVPQSGVRLSAAPPTERPAGHRIVHRSGQRRSGGFRRRR